MSQRLKYIKEGKLIKVFPVGENQINHLITRKELNDNFINPFGFVYKIINLENDKVYIGQTQRDAIIRWQEHIYESRRKNQVMILARAIQKYGDNAFEMEILKNCKSQEEMNKWELYYIKKYNSTDEEIGYNMTEGGKGGGKRVWGKYNPIYGNNKLKGRKRPEMSERMKGERNPFYGKTHNKASLEIISKKSKGRIFMTNGKENTSIKPEDLDKYVQLGYYRGRK